MKKSVISPQHLKALRLRKGWSQEELAEKSSLTARRISSLEKEVSDQVSVQQKTLKGLCKALGERPGVLAGEDPMPKDGKPFDLSVRLNPQTRLNYDLLKRKYNIDIEDIILVAPLLFANAAEESLQRQKEQVDKDAREYGNLKTLWHQIPGLGDLLKTPTIPWMPESDAMPPGTTEEDYFSERWHAVKNRDLFEGYLQDDYAPPWENPNPFADYLYEVSQRPLLKNDTEVVDERDIYQRYWYSSGNRVPDHSVCLDILEQITLGSVDARNALEKGVVSISEIPDDLWEPRRSGDRVAWLEDKYRHAEANKMEEESS